MWLYEELEILFLWISVACSHFSLVKSVQPDAHSYQHFNMWTAYSRAFYLVIFGSSALLLNLLLNLLILSYGGPDNIPSYVKMLHI